MHPAFSVIFFTVSSGAGYGSLIVFAVLAVTGNLPEERWIAAPAMGVSLFLITAGLLASTAHLGRPERAWRAFSQWRSSWLSREGIFAVATFVPALIFAAGWILAEQVTAWIMVSAAFAGIGAVATVVATAMIYASLRPIGEWANPLTLPVFLSLAIASGTNVANALFSWFDGTPRLAFAALMATALAGACKAVYWHRNDRLKNPVSLSSATGLPEGEMRSVEWPHSQPNYIMKEMGYRIARKHARRLRTISVSLAFLAPVGLLSLSIPLPEGFAPPLCLLAAMSQLTGLLIERWLFFAEARHVASIYYGLEASPAPDPAGAAR